MVSQRVSGDTALIQQDTGMPDTVWYQAFQAGKRGAVPIPTDVYTSKNRRPHGVHTRFSDDEFAMLSAAADSQNVSLADLVRRTVVESLTRKDEPTTTLLLEEIEALKLIFASTVPPILAGTRIQKDQSAALMRDCDAAKTDAAKKVLRAFTDRKDRP